LKNPNRPPESSGVPCDLSNVSINLKKVSEEIDSEMRVFLIDSVDIDKMRGKAREDEREGEGEWVNMGSGYV
jgi:hypothetical protein